jgi:EmrB/QacA subfamily drug resistance transporter
MSAVQPVSSSHRPWLAFALLCAGRFMVMLDLMIVVLALPAVQTAFNVAPSTTRWALSIYALCFGGFLLLAGKAGDLFGRRRLLMIGLATFSFASLVGGLAPSIVWFIAARALQGLGAAMISTTAFAAMTTLFEDAHRRNRTMAIWSALSGVAFPVGALVGGLLVAGPGWRWVMFVNVPLGLASFLLALPLLPQGAKQRVPAASERRKLDLPGATTVTVGLTGLVWVLSEGNVVGWITASTVIVATLSIALLFLFVAIERRTEEPVLKLDIFRDRSLLGANTTLLLGQAGLVACLFGLSFFLQRTLHLSSIMSGFAFIPTSIVFVLATNLSSRLVSRFGARLVVVLGSIAMAGGFYLYSRMSPGGYLVPFLGASVLVGLFGLALPVLFFAGVNGVPPAHRGAAAGLLNTSQQIGGALGLAIVAVVEGALGVSARTTAEVLGHGIHQVGGRTGGSEAVQSATSLVGIQLGFVACAVFLMIGAMAAMALIQGKGSRIRAST